MSLLILFESLLHRHGGGRQNACKANETRQWRTKVECSSTAAHEVLFGEPAFSHAGPATWNALPDHIRTVADLVEFRKLLKSHHFSQAFNIC